MPGHLLYAAADPAKSLQSCVTLSNPMDRSLPGSSIHGIFQERVLECGAIAFSILYGRDVIMVTNILVHLNSWGRFTHTHTYAEDK